MHNNCKLLPDHIVCKITQRNNTRRANTCDPALKLLNEERLLPTYANINKTYGMKEYFDAHMHNPHIHWKTIHGLSNRAPPPTLNSSMTFNNKITTTPKHIANYCFIKQFINTVKHATHKTNTSINGVIHKIHGYNITLTIIPVQEAITQSNNNNLQGLDKLNIRHLKHIGSLGLAFLTSMLKTDPKVHQRHKQGHLIQAHIHPFSLQSHWRRTFYLT